MAFSEENPPEDNKEEAQEEHRDSVTSQEDLAMKMKEIRKPEDYEALPEDNSVEDLAKQQLLIKSFWKECCVISFGFMFLFMGYYPVSAVQSSLNNDDGLGTAALSAKYASMAFGNLITNNLVVDRIGCKWTMSIGMLMYSSYIAANFYPDWWTLIPFGILSGIGGSAMWNAQGTYLTKLCDTYILLKHTSKETQASELATLKFYVFGLFNILYFGSNGLGNLVSSLILPEESSNGTSEARLQYCGADYCNEDLDNISGSSSIEPDKAHIYGLCGFCIISALIGVVLLVTLLDRLPTLGITEQRSGNRSVFHLLGATVRHWANPYQLLLIPLGLYNGMDNPFWGADYTMAFVTCPVGVHYVGYAVMCYGFTVPVFIFLFSLFNKNRTRVIPYFIALAAHLGVLITLLKWKPTPDDLGTIFGLSVVWGVGSGCWYPMMYAFYSIVFRENMEAAFSNFHLWSTLGSTLTYAWSHSFCVDVKIYIMMGIVSVGVVCYLITELHMFFTQKKPSEKTDQLDTDMQRKDNSYKGEVNPDKSLFVENPEQECP